MKYEVISFNKWSQERISQGKKKCTSRSRIWNDKRVYMIEKRIWKDIKYNLYKDEGADSPEELQKVVNKIFRRVVKDHEVFWVHWGFWKEISFNPTDGFR